MQKTRLFFISFLIGVSTTLADDVTIYRPLDPVPAPAAPVASATKAAVPAPASGARTYTVQKGDTLWKIARTQNVSVSGLRSANNLTSDTVRIGSVLKLPGAAAPVSSAPASEVRKAEPVAGPAPTTSAAVAVPAPASVPPPAPPAAAETHFAAALPPPADPTRIPVAVQLDMQKKFIDETKSLAQQGVRYDGDWRPPGEAEKWDMDCSNTSRWLYQKVAGIGLSRCASDQYYDLQQKSRVWDTPRDAQGEVDSAALFSQLQVGDLLFWENTYKPRRDPPVTHVMVFLGKNNRGQWLMAGSQCGGGFCNVSGSGPDIYVFDPCKLVGGYSKNFGFTHVRGRFTAYGRPLLEKLPGAGVQVAAAQ